jgi:hypothetical protein
MKSVHIGRICGSASAQLSEILSEISADTEIIFDADSYYFDRPVLITDKSNVIINGNGSTLVAHFDRKAYTDKSTDIFHFNRCSNLKLCGFTVDSDVPTNVAGKIIRHEGNETDVQLYPSVPLDGDEMFISSMTFEDDMTPTCGSFVSAQPDPNIRTLIAGEIPCTNPAKLNAPHKMIGNQLFRINAYCVEGDMTHAKCNISHSYYGLTAVIFRNCDNVTVEDIHFANYGGFAFAILPRCRDFTFRRLRFASKDPEHQPFSINADGIHITGLTGKITVEDCWFEQLGDDCINLHTHVMSVKELTDGGARIIYDKIGGKIAPEWGLKGDKLRVYNSDTLDFKGYAVIDSFKDGVVTVDGDSVALLPGDLITNEAFFPEFEATRCVAKNCRSRPFVIQSTNKARISDCDFYGCGPAVYISAAFKIWLEAGPAKNIEIIGNRFHRTSPRGKNTGDIFIRIAEDPDCKMWHKHENILIKDNVFENVPFYPIWVYAADNVKILSNTFKDCNGGEGDIHILNCTETEISDNCSYRNVKSSDVVVRDDI